MKIDNIECYVICDGQNLTEYQEKSEAKPNLKGKSCYIISETGKRFAVRVKNLKSAHQTDVTAHLWIDGQLLRRKPVHGSLDIDGTRADALTVRPFVFTSITLTEGNANANDLGTICLKVYRISGHKSIPCAHVVGSKSTRLDNKPVHEKSKKAGGHRVALGEARPSKKEASSQVTYIDELDFPYYTFTWRYRSKEMLQAQGIVPLDPMPLHVKRLGPSVASGSSSKRPRTEQSAPPQGSISQVKLEDTPTAQEIQAQVEALRTQRAALEAQEAALQERLRQAGALGIKRERSPIVLHGARSGDVIDLTEDD
ncbi:hypothetical protein BC629DRAFT_931276 [Irpex lacteus]|nr:hypothetical protein BC629DRAFT_931276 [Irpex lacteus]